MNAEDLCLIVTTRHCRPEPNHRHGVFIGVKPQDHFLHGALPCVVIGAGNDTHGSCAADAVGQRVCCGAFLASWGSAWNATQRWKRGTPGWSPLSLQLQFHHLPGLPAILRPVPVPRCELQIPDTAWCIHTKYTHDIWLPTMNVSIISRHENRKACCQSHGSCMTEWACQTVNIHQTTAWYSQLKDIFYRFNQLIPTSVLHIHPMFWTSQLKNIL